MMLRDPTLHLWLRPALSANYPRFLTAIDNLDGEVWDETRRDSSSTEAAQIADGALGHHPIVTGRGTGERVGTLTGQALGAPPGVICLLVLSASAMDRPVESVEIRQDSRIEGKSRRSAIRCPLAATAR